MVFTGGVVFYVLFNRNACCKKKTPRRIAGVYCLCKGFYCLCSRLFFFVYILFCLFCFWFFVSRMIIFITHFTKAKDSFIGSVKRKAQHSPAL